MRLTGSWLVEYIYPITLLGFILSATTLTTLFWWLHRATVVAIGTWVGERADRAMYAIVDVLMGCKGEIVMKDSHAMRGDDGETPN